MGAQDDQDETTRDAKEWSGRDYFEIELPTTPGATVAAHEPPRVSWESSDDMEATRAFTMRVAESGYDTPKDK